MTAPSSDLSTTRYGRRRLPRRVWVALTVVLVVVGIGWAWRVSQSASDVPVTAQMHSFDVQSDHSTKLTLQVHRNESGPATCAVYALAIDHSVVGERNVDIPASHDELTTVTSVIRTERRAANVRVRDCRLSD